MYVIDFNNSAKSMCRRLPAISPTFDTLLQVILLPLESRQRKEGFLRVAETYGAWKSGSTNGVFIVSGDFFFFSVISGLELYMKKRFLL